MQDHDARQHGHARPRGGIRKSPRVVHARKTPGRLPRFRKWPALANEKRRPPPLFLRGKPPLFQVRWSVGLVAEDQRDARRAGRADLHEGIVVRQVTAETADIDFVEQVGDVELPDLRRTEYVIAVVGPGTGFGASTLIKRDGRLTTLSGEAGHVGFAPENPLQVELLASLADQFGRVSDERLVSGSGLVNIFNFLTTRRQAESVPIDAATIFSRADRDQAAQEAVALFFELLGQAAGNFVLATGSFDGLFVAGGIVQRYPDLLRNSAFRTGFENKGRHRELMRAVPTVLVDHPLPGLLGVFAAAKSWY